MEELWICVHLCFAYGSFVSPFVPQAAKMQFCAGEEAARLAVLCWF